MVRVTARRVCLFGLVLLFHDSTPWSLWLGGWLGGTQKNETLSSKISVSCLWVWGFGTLLGPEETLVVFSGPPLMGFP